MTKPSRLEALFAAALALPVSEREGYLQRACGADHEVHAGVRSLLAAFPDACHFVKEPRSALEHAGDAIDHYRLLREIGEGGGGVVYQAAQQAPIKREVALKILKPGMDTRAVIARFAAERQTLALMDHPNIARVLDAGATPAGRPYFVMELVRGIRITDYCDHSRLAIAERLALFIQVAQAIAHAHLKGVIHRDIKPSNVLVTLHDGVPVAKVIDFGIAKALQGGVTESTLYTVFDQFMGTPAYVSPEQTEPGGLRVDTRSDIYSLGVLLYELLTGCTPFDTAQPGQAGVESLWQRIREEQPPSPSKRVHTLSEQQAADSALARGLTPDKLQRHLLGDLDAIVMRALRKEPDHRYGSVEQLIEDLRRYLSREPVLARHGNWLYYSQRFVRRHAFSVSAGAIVAVFILAFAIAMSIQATRIAAERDRAEKASEYTLSVLEASDPFVNQGRPLTMRELLDQTGRRVRGDLHQDPEIRARLLETIGRTYRRQNQYSLSISFLEEALRIRRRQPNGDERKTAEVLADLSNSQRFAGDLEAAAKTLQEAFKIVQRHNKHSVTYASVLTDLGRIEFQRGKMAAARQHFEESLALNQSLLEPRDPEIAKVLFALSGVFLWSDDFRSAERVIREAVSIYSEQVADLHPDRVSTEIRLAEVLLAQERVTEAAPLFEKSLTAMRTLYGEESRQVANVLDSLALIRHYEGRLAEAEELSRGSLTTQQKALGEHHYSTAYSRTSRASHLLRRGKYAEAERQLRHALETFAKTLPPDHQFIASAEHFLGEALLGMNRLEEAAATLTASIDRWRRDSAPAWRSARSANTLGEVLYRQGHIQEAERYLTDSYRIVVAAEGADRDSRDKARERVTRFYTERGQPQKLQELMRATNASGAVANARRH